MAVLVGLDPTDHRRFVLERARFYVLGRGDDCDIRIAGESVSRQHARIVCNEDSWAIEDLDSLNGVYVNGMPVRRAVLHEADIVRMAAVIFKFAAGPFDRPLDSDPGGSNNGPPAMMFAPQPAKN